MHASFVEDLAITLGVAALTGALARRLGQPSILGYLLAGLLVGPNLPVPVFADPERVGALAEFGVILVMFAVGLEFRIAKLVRLLPLAGLTGLVQISALLWAGYVTGQALGYTPVACMFLGGCLAISSTMVVSAVFAQTPVDPPIRELVLGVLVLQDVAAIALIAAFTAVAATGSLPADQLASTLTQLLGTLLALGSVGLLIVPRLIRALTRLESPEALTVAAIGLCFALALLAEHLGYSVALGAFLAGILVSESGEGHRVETLIRPVRDLFAAVFFVSVGMTVDPRLALDVLPTSLLVFAVVVVAQAISVSTAGILSGNGLRRSMTSGLALGQIGEFSFIIAAIGTAADVVPPSLPSVLVTVAVLTAFTTPLALRHAPRLVHLVDHLLPDRLNRLITLYETWLARSSPQLPHTPIRRAARAVALDALLLISLVSIVLAFAPTLEALLEDRWGVSVDRTNFYLFLGTAALALLPLIGLLRNALALSRIVADSAIPNAPHAARSLRAMIHLATVLAVGVPATLALRVVTNASYGIVALSLVVLAAFLSLYRRAGALDSDFRANAELFAELLARQTHHDLDHTLEHPTLPPGFDALTGTQLHPDAPAVGRTLAEIDLRAQTGVTVVAIHRASGDTILPTGRERLHAHDTLALAGPEEARQRASSFLLPALTPEDEATD